jgi:hypothetical protein
MKTLTVSLTLFLALLTISASADDAKYSAFKRKGGNPWQKSWTTPALNAIRYNMNALNRAADKEKYCPGYSSASKELKENCWLRIVSGITAFESANRPGSVGDKWNPARNGGPAYGLMQIQARNCRGSGNPQTPDGNLKCGVAMMARLISRDRVISSEEIVPPGKRKFGGAATSHRRLLGLAHGGWSTMRGGMAYIKPLGKMMMVGHLGEIAQGVNGYQNHSTGTIALRFEGKLDSIASRRRGLLGVSLV